MENKKMGIGLLIGEIIVALITTLFYVLLDKFDMTVIYGSVLGVALTMGYYFLLTFFTDRVVEKIMDQRSKEEMSEEEVQKFVKENENKLKNRMQVSFILRGALIFIVLALAFLAKVFAPFATVIPVLMESPILMILGIVIKGAKK